MKVLSIGTDRKLFEEGSAVLERQKEYASRMEELHIIVFSLKRRKLLIKQINNLYIYPTNSSYRFTYIFDAIRIGKNIIKERKFLKDDSIITTQDPFETGLVGYILKNKFKLPLQLQIHTDFLNRYFKNSLLNRVRVVLSKFLIPRANGLRVVSSIISDSLKNEFPNLKAKVDILPIFIDIDNLINYKSENTYAKNIPISSKFDFVILMASRFTKEKRIDVGLAALKVVTSRFPRTGLFIIGFGSHELNLYRESARFGLQNNVIFIHWTENLREYFDRVNLFLLTSEYEGYGMTLIEAGASGCPIVTTRVGVAKTDLFKDGINSFVCPVGDVDCLSNRITELISDPIKRESFKTNMRDSIKAIAISKEEYTANYIGLLEKLLEITKNV